MRFRENVNHTTPRVSVLLTKNRNLFITLIFILSYALRLADVLPVVALKK